MKWWVQGLVANVLNDFNRQIVHTASLFGKPTLLVIAEKSVHR